MGRTVTVGRTSDMGGTVSTGGAISLVPTTGIEPRPSVYIALRGIVLAFALSLVLAGPAIAQARYFEVVQGTRPHDVAADPVVVVDEERQDRDGQLRLQNNPVIVRTRRS